ncbi:class I SAM-dependent methyltransferase [Kitasatospora sp. NPDC048286]|uniref:class I SAM-dependent methyltransferase n=1 Tax=Kitasatospora sp. NPDC048286 TaxID=3364047 RepID=UPI0037171853
MTQTPVELLTAFTTAGAEQRDAAFRHLVAALWQDGRASDLAPATVPALLTALDQAPPERQGWLVLLLGLLAGAEPPSVGGESAEPIGKELDRFLELLADRGAHPGRTLALLYLLSHFPADRDRILAAVEPLEPSQDDLSRLDRVLRPLDPATAVLGRVWPSPAEWVLSEAERAFDRSWVDALAPAQLAATWDGDTRMLIGYSGAKAYWALRHGTTEVVADTSPHRTTALSADAVGTADLTRHAEVLRCPACTGRLDVSPGGARCADCAAEFSSAAGHLDLFERSEPSDPKDVLQNAAAMRNIGLHYETVLRPAFLRLMGGNFGGQVTPADEDRYIAAHTNPVDGPVLDLAAGAGRWTAVLAEAVGAERLIALDLNPAMLTWLSGRLPEVPALRASAQALPFGDATLGAVNCWNALQAMPDPAGVIAEVGRCLRPGGSFTLLTFLQAADPVDRHFQGTFRGPGFPDGMPLFALADLRAWLAAAGLTVRDQYTPGTFAVITAERAA